MEIINRIKKDISINYKGILIVIVYCTITQLLFGYICPFRLLTGIPCPACGLTRAGISLLCFDINKGLFYNPMIIPIALLIIYWFVCRYILDKKAPYITGISILLCTALLILYAYRMYNDFPDHYPMEYVSHNVFSPIYKFLGGRYNIHLFNIY